MKAATELSDKYRCAQPPADRFIVAEIHRLAYLTVRMPATFAAARAVFAETRRLAPEMRVESLLDLGAGSGSAGWAAAEVFGEIRRMTFVEQDEGLVRLGQSIARESGLAALNSADWKIKNLRAGISLSPHDLVVFSYSLGEIHKDEAIKIVKAAWRATGGALVVVEPGTMKGFKLIRAVREELIQAGGHIVAPCPHRLECPMTGDDWCHFAQRFERSSLHRRIKAGSLGYEDEKFSYIVAAKTPVQSIQSRVIRHPLKRPGFVQIQLCSLDRLQRITVSKSDRENWKRARKTEWGDEWR
jgi:ribosomal protein RSM22 (predicted rRNA methylase)